MNSLATIHIAKKQLGLDDDTYQALLLRVTGKKSAKDMSEHERFQVIDEFRKSGFKRAFKPSQKALEGTIGKKLQALWIAAWNLGLVANRSDAALVAFVKRQTGLDAIRFLRYPDDAAKVIEALKKWIERAGVDWKGNEKNGFKIAQAQAKKLNEDFATAVFNVMGGSSLGNITDAQWQVVMNALGERIRRAKKNGCL